MDDRPIGVFDSGTGGISVLRNLIRQLPGEDFIYYGDDKNAPYGTKPEEQILKLARKDVAFLLDRNVKAIVIACNTATSAAAKTLRSEMEMPIIGVEPALKPAQLARKGGYIAVLATPATLRQRKFTELMKLYGDHAVPLPCPGLMEFAQRGETQGERLDAFLADTFRDILKLRPESAVLGCTHYVFMKQAISKALGGIPLYDGNEGTARQLKRVLEQRGLLSTRSVGSVKLCTSAQSDAVMETMSRLLDMPIED
ncbi:MAG: glutamate racemase [Clostridiales bacterium]|nr:glutamate racemase [Clostridiales bacterium]